MIFRRSAPVIFPDWHDIIVDRARWYEHTPYQPDGRSYNGVDTLGLVLGVANAIGRPLQETKEDPILLKQLYPVATPYPGDLVVSKDGSIIGIIADTSGHVYHALPSLGVSRSLRDIYHRRWYAPWKVEISPRFHYYCLLKGVWHEHRRDTQTRVVSVCESELGGTSP